MKSWMGCGTGVPKLSFSSQARVDIENFRDFGLGKFGTSVAAAYVDDVRQAALAIRERPSVGRNDDDLSRGMRSVRCRSHRIYDQVEGESVLTVRLLHRAQDAERALRQPE